MIKTYLFLILLIIVSITSTGYSQNKISEISTNIEQPGEGLLPVPQKVSLSDQHHLLNDSWTIELAGNTSKNDPAVLSLLSGLKERFGLRLNSTNHNSDHKIQLNITAGSVSIGKTTDTNRVSLQKQAYKLSLQSHRVSITANAAPGLFYGVQTFIQLLQDNNGKVYFAGGEIKDWPNMDMRMIYWDDAHHLERLDAMKRIIKQASYYKINAFSLKLEGHFQFSSAKSVIEPYAYTPAEYQELTDYARSLYVELVPFLDAPAHIAFILKHPEYKRLRAFSNSNYELNVLDPKADQLILGMMNDLMDANKGGKYFLFSTDEAYYVGMSESEKKRADILGGNGRLLAEYITRIANKLHEKGRKIIIWGEYPLKPSDINSLPSHIINGVYDEKTAPIFKEHGMRQAIYTSLQGEEPLFPKYYKMSPSVFSANSSPSLDDEEQQSDLTKGRVPEMLKEITSAVAADKSDFMGVIVAGWADAGLNPETFWLGYATGAAAGWNSQSVTDLELTSHFYNSFYGNSLNDIDKVYKLLSTQADFWAKSWEWMPSKNRLPIFGNSAAVYDSPKLAKDQVLPGLPVPAGTDLSLDKNWNSDNSRRLDAAEKFLTENDELMNLLSNSIIEAKYQHYNLQVLRSVAQLCRQNLTMLLDLQKINNLLKLSADAAAAANPSLAVSLVDQALKQVKKIRDERNEVLQTVTTVWYQDWYPRVAKANGRKFLDSVDDVKDHVPARTVDMSYLIYRQLKFPLGRWAQDVLDARNQFANKYNLPMRKETFDWENIKL